jgi:hypothetical protein
MTQREWETDDQGGLAIDVGCYVSQLFDDVLPIMMEETS